MPERKALYVFITKDIDIEIIFSLISLDFKLKCKFIIERNCSELLLDSKPGHNPDIACKNLSRSSLLRGHSNKQ